ncbi:hypothetical protein Bhyg_04459 [Pseudolycoriella hygida]|uniref:Uncharacterized protein n=1 Tax=Pseudolycoriella hygida TaxID=35572 RepID=A0A9Q0SA74_9DIPT|nr:hypothetical protein Bhyg_04459 [Pseudolycoriella hygida]
MGYQNDERFHLNVPKMNLETI